MSISTQFAASCNIELNETLSLYTLNILHIETGRHLAGGPKQVLTLMQGLKTRNVLSTLLCPDNSEIAVAAKKLGLSVRAVPYKGEHDIKFAKHIKQVVKQLKPDVIHVHSRRGADTFASWFARFSKVPAILTRRVVNHESGFVANFKFKPYKKIIAVSEAVNLILKRQGIEEKRRSVIYDGVDSSEFSNLIARPQFLREFELPDNALIFANVGRFTENKNQADSIEAFSLMAEAIGTYKQEFILLALKRICHVGMVALIFCYTLQLLKHCL